MKYLKTKNISKHSISDRTLIVEQPSGTIITNTKSGIKFPVGEKALRPNYPEDGMIRYTTNSVTDHEIAELSVYFPDRSIGFEVYYDSVWYPIRLQGPAKVIRKDLGVGNWDGIFQPNEELSKWFPSSGEPLELVPGLDQNLNPQDYVYNMSVYVENVYQIANTNFTLEESDGKVVAVEVTNTGAGYTTANIEFAAPDLLDGVQATGTAVIESGEITEINITNAGSGYTSVPEVFITGDGNDAAATSRIAKPGWHIKFFTAVPDTKPVTVFYGSDQ